MRRCWSDGLGELFSLRSLEAKLTRYFFRELPPILAERSADARLASPHFSPQSEAVLALEFCCRIMLASRRLHLTTANITTNGASKVDRVDRAAELRVELKKHRLQLLSEIKQLIQSGVKLGAAGLLWRCDICESPWSYSKGSSYLFYSITVNGYRLLMAGRLTLAVVLSAQEDNDSACETEAIHTLEACLLLLKHFAASFPTSIGAAETLKETCRGELASFASGVEDRSHKNAGQSATCTSPKPSLPDLRLANTPGTGLCLAKQQWRRLHPCRLLDRRKSLPPASHSSHTNYHILISQST